MKWNHRNLYKELQEFSQENLNSYIWEECICIKKKKAVKWIFIWVHIIILGLNNLKSIKKSFYRNQLKPLSNHKWKRKKDFFPLELWEAMFPLFLTVGYDYFQYDYIFEV